MNSECDVLVPEVLEIGDGEVQVMLVFQDQRINGRKENCFVSPE